MVDKTNWSPELHAEVDRIVYETAELNINRRQLLGRSLTGFTGLYALTALPSCNTVDKTRASQQLNVTPEPPRRVAGVILPYVVPGVGLRTINITGQDIHYDYDEIILQNFPVSAAPAPDNQDFIKQVTFHASAVAGLIKYYLTDSNLPYKNLFPTLFNNRVTKGLFRPEYGPVIAYRHQDVLNILKRPDMFTVDLYAPVMATATSGHPQHGFPQPPPKTPDPKQVPQWRPADGIQPDGTNDKGYFNHFILGTDQDDLYIPDSKICRYVVKRSDIGMLRAMIRQICEDLLRDVRPGMEFDMIGTIGRFAPVRIVKEYLGLPSYKPGEAGTGLFKIKDGHRILKGGDTFEINADLAKRYAFKHILPTAGKLLGIVPTEQQAYEWIRDTFRNTFNNFGRIEAWDKAGAVGTEYLLAWSMHVIQHYKAELAAGRKIPDTMITRLIQLQRDATAEPAKFATLFSCTEEDLKARIKDDRIQVNAFGTFVGAVANPEEANGRIIAELMRLKSGEREALKGSYDELKALADRSTSPGSAEDNEIMQQINAYAIELLRLNPQGEILLRKCLRETKLEPSGEGIKAGTTIFAAHGAAMHDEEVAPDPEKFVLGREAKTEVYSYTSALSRTDPRPTYQTETRSDENPHNVVYLHHGFGRHKCLGRYASEITMEEVLRAVLRLGDVQKVRDLVIDQDGLYAESFVLKVM